MQKLIIIGILFSLLFAVQANRCLAQIKHEVFLANTDHELHVYRILGKEPGKTIMLIGGIQGDEPGSYMTADLYADVHLKKGNLIVVPRANFYSILLNRREGVTGDMNRKFGTTKKKNSKNHLEDEIVAILKHLIAESDCLLNLHEGSGYYSPDWISDIENPKRYGQSLIFDTPEYSIPGTNNTVHLESLAKKVIDAVNPKITNKRYHFKPNNHDTFSDETLHSEQRKSATYYAVTRANIPAFGVETSKSIKSLEEKINLQKLIVNSFMEQLDIIIDTPGIMVDQPKLAYLLLSINDKPAFAMPNGSKLSLNLGDDVVVTDIIANYERGLVADIEGVGSANDTHIPFRISGPTRIVVRKDAIQAGWVDLEPDMTTFVNKNRAALSDSELLAKEIVINVEGKMETIQRGQCLRVKKGTRLIMQGVKTNIAHLDSNVFLNFKGFAPPKSKNDGNDINYPIYTGQDLWKRYSEKKLGKRYPIEATYKDKQIGKFWVELL